MDGHRRPLLSTGIETPFGGRDHKNRTDCRQAVNKAAAAATVANPPAFPAGEAFRSGRETPAEVTGEDARVIFHAPHRPITPTRNTRTGSRSGPASQEHRCLSGAGIYMGLICDLYGIYMYWTWSGAASVVNGRTLPTRSWACVRNLPASRLQFSYCEEGGTGMAAGSWYGLPERKRFRSCAPMVASWALPLALAAPTVFCAVATASGNRPASA